MTDATLLTRIDQALLNLVAIVEETSRHLARLQLDEETEDKTLQVHTRACAMQLANLRGLTQLRKQLVALPASAPMVGAALHPAAPASQSPCPDSLNPKLRGLSNPDPAPPPRPASLSTPNSELRTQNSKLPPPQPPTPDPLPSTSGALLKNVPNVAKLNIPLSTPRDLSPAPAGALMCGFSLLSSSRRKAG